MSINREIITDWFKDLQDQICKNIAQTDEKADFVQELWDHPISGGGRTRILQKGNILEKAGVNFSAVAGKLSPNIQEALKLSNDDFFATGVSIVMHPISPMVPIIHMNVRYFETKDGYWFGGGIDLTPHYIVADDAAYFHQELKSVCDAHDPDYYPRFKKWADDYFYNVHRQETRGVGGIFFDRLSENSEKHTKSEIWDFIKSVGKAFCPIYIHFLKKNHHIAFTENEKHWQHLRRGRYVEFNLVYDKGTKFGFETSGRTESILMSLPPLAEWEYQYKAIPGSAEEYTLEHLKKGINWVK